MKNKWVAVLLAFFLAGLGIHRFYVGDTKWGVIFLVFSWTAIPAIIGLVDAIRWAFMDEAEFHAKYSPAFKYGNGGGSGAAQTTAALLLAGTLAFGALAGTSHALTAHEYCSELAKACVAAYNDGARYGNCDGTVLAAAVTAAAALPQYLQGLFVQTMGVCCLNGVNHTGWSYQEMYNACMAGIKGAGY